MTSPTSSVIAIGWLVLAGAALGFVLGRWVVAPMQVPSVETGAPATQDLTPILAELRKLNETLQTQRAKNESTPAATPDREPASPRSDTTDRFEAAVEHLDQVLKGAEARLGRGQASIERAKGEGYASLDAMFQRAESLKETFTDEVRARHILWSLEDVVGRYGTPSNIYSNNGGVELQYVRNKAAGESEMVALNVSNGLVVSGWYQ